MPSRKRQPDAEMLDASWAQLVGVLVMLCGGGIAWMIYLIWLLMGLVGAAS